MNDLKNALSVLIKLAEKIDAADADGKFTIGEDFGIAIAALGLIKIVKNAKALKDEFLALSDADKSDLDAFFKSELQLRNKSTESTVEEVFSALLKLSDGIGLFVNKSTVAPGPGGNPGLPTQG